MDKQLKRFTFYDLYWKLVKNVNNITAGRIIKNICEYEFCGTQPSQIADDTEAFMQYYNRICLPLVFERVLYRNHP